MIEAEMMKSQTRLPKDRRTQTPGWTTREKDWRYKGGYVCRLWKQRREEMAWEVEQNHLTNVEREPASGAVPGSAHRPWRGS
jgi:hypothetical protein